MLLELQEGNKGRCTVLLDGEVYCRCYRKDLQSVGISEGEEAGEAALFRLNQEVLFPRAKRRSLLLLNKKRYTRQEMVKKLKSDGYPEQTVEETLSYLQELHYIDDISYAQGYASFWIPKCSARELYQKMLQKGFERETVSEAIKEAQREYVLEKGEEEEEGESPELSAIRDYLRKKGYQSGQVAEEKRKKLAAALYRKGFSFSDIKRVMGEFDEITENGENFITP
ncbi:MAG: regulatory protein RecX [Lachnospiraceae bacterium]|nr:regulatory protein RecX [Lachnospiraceae bacterium]